MSRNVCSQDTSPLAPTPPRPQPGYSPAPSSSDTRSVTLDMLTSVLLDYSCLLTSRISGWVTRAAWPATSADGQPNHQSSNWYPTSVHAPPPSRKGVPQRRTTAIALAPVLLVTHCAVFLVLPCFCSPSPVAAQVAHSELDDAGTGTRVAGVEQRLPAPASAPAPAPAPVPTPAADHAQFRRGA